MQRYLAAMLLTVIYFAGDTKETRGTDHLAAAPAPRCAAANELWQNTVVAKYRCSIYRRL